MPWKPGRHENWGIFKCHKWGELIRQRQGSARIAELPSLAQRRASHLSRGSGHTVLHMNCSCREVLDCHLEGLQWPRERRRRSRPRASRGSLKRGRGSAASRSSGFATNSCDRPRRPRKGAWYKRWRRASLDGSTQMRSSPSRRLAHWLPSCRRKLREPGSDT